MFVSDFVKGLLSARSVGELGTAEDIMCAVSYGALFGSFKTLTIHTADNAPFLEFAGHQLDFEELSASCKVTHFKPDGTPEVLFDSMDGQDDTGAITHSTVGSKQAVEDFIKEHASACIKVSAS